MSTGQETPKAQTEPSAAAIAASPKQIRLHRFLLAVFLLAVSVAASASLLHSYQAEARKQAALRSPAGMGGTSCGAPAQGCGASQHSCGSSAAGKTCGAGPRAIGTMAREWSKDYGPATAPTTLAYLVDPTQTTPEDRSVVETLSTLTDRYAGKLRVVVRPYAHPDARAYGAKGAAVMISEPESAKSASGAARYRVLFGASPGKGHWTAEQLRDKVRSAIGAPPKASARTRAGTGA